VTPEEKAVIQAAIKAYGSRWVAPGDVGKLREAVSALVYSCNECNYDRHTCPGCGEPIGHGDGDCGKDCTDSSTMITECLHPGVFRGEVCAECGQGVGFEPSEPLWIERTWADVRKGDRVRMPGSGVEAVIADRLWHPSEDPAGTSWHVVQSAESGQYAHTGDRVVQPGECVIVSPDIPGSDRGRYMNPAAPVEILVPGGQVTLDAMAVLAEELGRDAWKMRAGFSHETSGVIAPYPTGGTS
jgi:hypothetical protein